MSLPAKGLIAGLILVMVLMMKSSYQGRVVMALGLVAVVIYMRTSGRKR